jgi:hypothetical protein
MKTNVLINTLLMIIICSFSVSAFSPGDEDIEKAYQNAKKGIQWGLTNIKVKKAKLDNELIADNQLLARVRVEKQINGIRMIVTGYNGTTEVVITAYRTFESLVTDGYLDKNFLRQLDDE